MLNHVRVLFLASCLVVAGTFTLVGEVQQQQQQQSPPPPTRPPQQPTEVQVTLSGTGGTPPKLAIAGFIPMSNDAETVAAAKTIGDVLYDDLNYEREYYVITKDAVATVPKPTSIDSVPLDGWCHRTSKCGH